MSSLAEPKTLSFDEQKKSIFKLISLEKYPFTAFASVQVAGSLVPQESLLQLIDSFVCRSRVMIQKTSLYLFDYKMCFAVLLFWIYAFTKYAKLNNPFERKIEKVKVEESKPESIIETKEEEEEEEEEVEEQVETMTVTEFRSKRTLQFISESSSSITATNTNTPNRQNRGFVVIVYASASLVYIQLILLAVFLQTTSTPPGLVFLVSSLGLIGFIVFQICFVKAKSKEISKVNKTNEKTIAKLSKPIAAHSRLLRSTTRRFLYFHNKTLSKIKLI